MSTGEGRRPANVHSRAIAEFVASTTWRDIPERVRTHAKLDILDTIGCALFGQSLAPSTLLHDAFVRQASAGPSSIWGRWATANPELAALVNGTATHSFELDDLHPTAILHPGGVILPAALATAEAGRTTSGLDLLAAHVIGVEVSARVGLAAGVSLLRRGWHPSSVVGVFGSAAAVSSILHLDARHTLQALGIAGSLAGGLMAAQYGSMVKRLHSGQASQNGLRAALLAEAGVTGIEAIFEEEYGGFLSTFAGAFDVMRVSSGLGDQWETLNVGFKRHAACGSSHTTVDVLLEMRERGLGAADVLAVRVNTSSATRDHVGWPYQPGTTTTAQMNLGYAAAVALMDGEVSIEQFDNAHLQSQSIAELASRVEVVADSEIDAKGPSHRHEVKVEVELRSGRRLVGHAVHPRGSAANPIDERAVKEKFVNLASRRFAPEEAKALSEVIMNLDRAADLRELSRWLRTE